jgi:D-alanyl-lipoteichoic acid acyltransferase DltB (MBOAT superfamily)
MVFSSASFLFFFLPLFLAIYFVTPGVRVKNYVLTVFSLIFYVWGDLKHLPLLAGLIAVNYLFALAIGSDARFRRAAFWLGIAFNVSVLFVCKYTGFFIVNINTVISSLNLSLEDPGIVMPLGISFFTFHAISYLVDVYRRKAQANRRFDEIFVYMAMFPQLIAGPIVRYSLIAKSIRDRRTTLGRVSAGLRIFVIGLAWKVLIADEVAKIVAVVFDGTTHPNFSEAWIGTMAYAVQIYFDFAGYSNMAIGLALALGLHFPRNFRLPYSATSVGDFWRRWHISLSFWFRDYVYIPLGGNRGRAMRTAGNLWTVFLLCGLWHGANWTFVIWGIHHGFFLVLERGPWGAWLARVPRYVGNLYTLLVVLAGWVWFRAKDVSQAVDVFSGLAGLNGFGPLSQAAHIVLHPISITALVVGWLLAVFGGSASLTRTIRTTSQPVASACETAFIGAIFVFSLLAVGGGSFSPFLYFQF